MVCNGYTERIYEYLDEELDIEEKANLEKHLETCSDCRTMFTELNTIHFEILNAIENVPIPQNLEARILNAVIEDRKIMHKELILTGLGILAIGSPLLFLFLPLFSTLLHLIYTAGSVFLRMASTLLKLISPLTGIGIGILALCIVLFSLYFIRTLLHGLHLNEVLS